MVFSCGAGSSSCISHFALTVRGSERVEVSNPSTKAAEQSQGLGLNRMHGIMCGCIYACVYAYCTQIHVYMYSEWRGNTSKPEKFLLNV